ncbi:MAG: DNA gyrase inhibitor YacG [Betaproteobacteria bacterium]|nr:DNA gyrase inhibitor YacG [Betaproteobacteria bacterium]MDH3436855.1 DNA gyrase inhibitor YacG [Betaproteobacteria bacterium]
MNPKPRAVNCPTCGKPVLWTPDSAWRPFCSNRCKMIDLGAWATERYRVPAIEDADQPESAGPGESEDGA